VSGFLPIQVFIVPVHRGEIFKNIWAFEGLNSVHRPKCAIQPLNDCSLRQKAVLRS
jgi:hypothetical protein